jgi:hypothetical protein
VCKKEEMVCEKVEAYLLASNHDSAAVTVLSIKDVYAATGNNKHPLMS